MPDLKNELEYFIAHQAELVQKYGGKYIVIKDNNVVDVYDTLSAAYDNASQKYELGSFLIQHCLPGDAAYKQTFHSRVAFS